MTTGCPAHVGVIMDGNGRWAEKHGLPRSAGHKKGAEAMEALIKYAEKNTDIKYLTFYAFSTENWSRPKDEVKSLMSLFDTYLDRLIADKDRHDTALRFIGDRSVFSETIRDKMSRAERKSGDDKRLTVFIAVNYGGRNEIAAAAKSLADDVKSGKKTDEITEKDISDRLYAPEAPDADLIIRPSGEKRLSNFLLWQSAYAEFWFDDVLWPDFKGSDLIRAVEEYKNRSRRFGGI